MRYELFPNYVPCPPLPLKVVGHVPQLLWERRPQIRTRPRFLHNDLPPRFIILCLLVRKLSSWQTNKQTDVAENIKRSSLRYDVGQMSFTACSVCQCYFSSFLFYLFIFTRTWVRYVRVFAVANPSVCRLSSVCNIGAPYSGGWTFRHNFFTAVYAGHPLTSVQNFTEVVLGEPFRRGRWTQEGYQNTAILDLSKAISHKRYKIDV